MVTTYGAVYMFFIIITSAVTLQVYIHMDSFTKKSNKHLSPSVSVSSSHNHHYHIEKTLLCDACMVQCDGFVWLIA